MANITLALISQTFREAIRTKWLIMFTLVFFLLVINLPTLVLLVNGEMPQDYINTYLQYLVSISFPYLPLLSLPVAALSVVEERESGTLQYLLSYPISRVQYLVGRIGGLLLATSAILLIGYGLAAIATYSVDVGAYGEVGFVMLVAICLNACMIALALVVSILSRRKITALGIAIFIWFALSVLSDIGYLGFLLNVTTGPTAVLILVIINPIVLAQSVSAYSIDPTVGLGTPGILRSVLGSSAPEVMITGLLVWTLVLLGAVFLIFRRRDLV
jgi:ABC-type transport system involved in multi-copper enzyme maturation permease subunit